MAQRTAASLSQCGGQQVLCDRRRPRPAESPAVCSPRTSRLFSPLRGDKKKCMCHGHPRLAPTLSAEHASEISVVLVRDDTSLSCKEVVLFLRKILCAILLICAVVLLAPLCVRAQQSYEVITQNGVPMKTRDGVTLYSDIYRPRGDGKFPVILMRTPYDKSVGWAASPAYQIATHGYVVIVQDVRGRYTSEGEWYTFRHESDDGYDAVEWAAMLPYSSGKVGMMGGSYVGATQMLAAIAHPPHLAGICPVVTASNYHDGWTYQGGALEQWFDQNWATQLATNTLWRLIAKNTNALLGAPTLPLTHYQAFNYPTLPAGADATAQLAPYYLDWLAHPDYDAYWKQWSI